MGATHYISAIIMAALITTTSPAQAQYQAEITFDDTDDGGINRALNNMEGDSGVIARLEGFAKRSALNEGRYGRAADFPGARGAVVFDQWTPTGELVAHMWYSMRSTESGSLIAQPGIWDVHLVDGGLAVQTVRRDGETVVVPLDIPWPTDGAFHHVTLVIERLLGRPTFTLTLDFITSRTHSFMFQLAQAEAPLKMGDQVDGMLDEVIFANNTYATLSDEQDRFNRDPNGCVDDAVCEEDVITITPRGFPYEVPVRLKTIYRPSLCSEAEPCPLLVAIQGGGDCANDYLKPIDLHAMLDEGFVVATIDPYCEARGKTFLPDSEVSQLVAAKNFVQQQGFAKRIISGPDYAATGCSHGAEVVMLWAMFEQDHPSRTFARSAAGLGICAKVEGQICGIDGGMENFPQDIENEVVRDRSVRIDTVSRIIPEVVESREIARSWGVNLEGPVCNADGSVACNEEGEWAMTYASRRFRDVWKATESLSAPTGYFVEDVSTDCRHCATQDSEAFRCGMCMLRAGRAGMATECPACLTYDDNTVRPGAAGEQCGIEASWYDDPITHLDDLPRVESGDSSDSQTEPEEDTPSTPAEGSDAAATADADPSSKHDASKTAVSGGCAASRGTLNGLGWFLLCVPLLLHRFW